MEKSNRSYVYGRYHIRRKGQKERKKNMETSIYENGMKKTKKKHKIIPIS
jgi:hypothetical protein